jgi:hypothetical protein
MGGLSQSSSTILPKVKEADCSGVSMSGDADGMREAPPFPPVKFFIQIFEHEATEGVNWRDLRAVHWLAFTHSNDPKFIILFPPFPPFPPVKFFYLRF